MQYDTNAERVDWTNYKKYYDVELGEEKEADMIHRLQRNVAIDSLRKVLATVLILGGYTLSFVFIAAHSEAYRDWIGDHQYVILTSLVVYFVLSLSMTFFQSYFARKPVLGISSLFVLCTSLGLCMSQWGVVFQRDGMMSGLYWAVLTEAMILVFAFVNTWKKWLPDTAFLDYRAGLAIGLSIILSLVISLAFPNNHSMQTPLCLMLVGVQTYLLLYDLHWHLKQMEEGLEDPSNWIGITVRIYLDAMAILMTLFRLFARNDD